MENTLNSFTRKFLSFSRLSLFILFLMASFNWYSSADPIPGYVTIVVNLIGGVALLSWVHAIGVKANQSLIKQNLNLSRFKYFNVGFLFIVSSSIAMLFLSPGQFNYERELQHFSYKFSYTEPLAIALIFLISLLFTFSIAAKALVSAERGRITGFGEYFTTLILISISWIGVWFIHPRIKKLNTLNIHKAEVPFTH